MICTLNTAGAQEPKEEKLCSYRTDPALKKAHPEPQVAGGSYTYMLSRASPNQTQLRPQRGQTHPLNHKREWRTREDLYRTLDGNAFQSSALSKHGLVS